MPLQLSFQSSHFSRLLPSTSWVRTLSPLPSQQICMPDTHEQSRTAIQDCRGGGGGGGGRTRTCICLKWLLHQRLLSLCGAYRLLLVQRRITHGLALKDPLRISELLIRDHLSSLQVAKIHLKSSSLKNEVLQDNKTRLEAFSPMVRLSNLNNHACGSLQDKTDKTLVLAGLSRRSKMTTIKSYCMTPIDCFPKN